MKTLGWIIGDYVAHMEQHLSQIFPDHLKIKPNSLLK